MRFYEVHKYVGDRWELAAVSDEKESALADAGMLIERSRVPMGVRVLRVVSQEYTNGDIIFTEQMIFRQSTLDEHNAEANARVAHAWQEVEAAREKRRLERVRRRAAPPRSSDLLRLILGLTIVAWIVVLAMVLAHQHVFPS